MYEKSRRIMGSVMRFANRRKTTKPSILSDRKTAYRLNYLTIQLPHCVVQTLTA
jgi:hypothetical protein